jgi:hypothetical protein
MTTVHTVQADGRSIPEYSSATAASNDAAKPTNIDRLRAHLAADGLASKLLNAWLAEPSAGAQSRMLSVLDGHNSAAQVADASSTSPKT